MKTEEFNLSEKIFNPTEVFQLKLPTLDSLNCIDVKEFIRLLKEKLVNPPEFVCACCWDNKEIIDKLAGEKLI